MSTIKTFLDGRVTLHCGDCRDAVSALADDSVDSAVMDPPYALVSIVKRFGKVGSAPAKSGGATGVYARASSGFMGKQWDTGEVAFDADFWFQVLRVLKPGAHPVAFSGTRTYHRMVCAIEDAGFEIRDQIGWAYGSGFPKSMDVAKAIDKAARGVPQGGSDPTSPNHGKFKGGCSSENESGRGFGAGPGQFMAEAGVSVERQVAPEAEAWKGWGTALKPSWEPIVLARKPLIGTVADNVLTYGTGALNIDGCRVETDENLNGGAYAKEGGRGVSGSLSASGMNVPGKTVGTDFVQPAGRWPANLIHDGSDEVIEAFPDAPGQQRAVTGEERSMRTLHAYGDFGASRTGAEPRGDSGSAARFFYAAKADSHDRLGSKHPTVKPLDLMQYLVRLVTPKGGTVLDPFAGTGTTGEAAWREGMNAILVERDEEYQTDIERRMGLADKPTKRAAVAMTKNNLANPDDFPLFKEE